MVDNRSLRTGLGIIAGALSTEHFFTVTLSSVGATKRFFADDEGKALVDKSLLIATILSFGLAITVDVVLGTMSATITAAVLAVIFILIYQGATGRGPLAGWI